MSGIAEVLLNLGYPVSGSDIKRSSTITRLKRNGAKIYIGHQAKNIEDSDVVIVSSAIKTNNPEVVAALKKGVPVIQRAEMLAELMRLAKYGIAVAGTHGKTTTTSLLSSVLRAGKLDPTIVIGGKVKGLRSNARLGKGDFILIEADESDGSFLKLFPTIAVVTNMDREHMDHYGSWQEYQDAFYRFCQRLPFYGVAILCGENPETMSLSQKIEKRFLTYGFSFDHDWNAQNIEHVGTKSFFELFKKKQSMGRIELNIPGRHNVLNSLAAIAVGFEIGISIKKIAVGLKQFNGVGRRMEVLYKGKDIVAIDDYGHHPTEISATLEAIRRAYAGRLVVLFQPHRYTRTKDLFDKFVRCFDLADHLFVMGIYSAGETPIKGVNAQKLVSAIKCFKKDKVQYISQPNKIIAQMLGELKPGDVFLSLGAGDVTKVARKIAKELKKKGIKEGSSCK